MIKKTLFIGLVLSFSISVNAQKASSQFKAKYATAKQLLEQEKFSLAKQSFKSLLVNEKKNNLVVYAQFYLGVAAYQDGDTSYAKNIFLQLSIEQPSWSKVDAVYLWLSRIGFEQSGVFKGMLYANKIKTEPYFKKSTLYVKSQIGGQSIEVLEQLHNKYPNNRAIGEEYLKALYNLPYSEQPQLVITYLIEKFNFERGAFTAIPPSVFKNHYTVGIMLPLFIDRMEATGKYLKKSLAVDIYEGAKMAAHDIDSTLFTLKVFDTKKDSSQVSLFLREGGLAELDAILGPIYPKPVEKMREISLKEKVNFLNPTSSNSAICKDNPYAFLSRASATQLAQKAAAYMSNQNISKNVYIYYGTSDVDSISAFTYSIELEKDSFNIKAIMKIGVENRRDVYDGLTASKKTVDRRKTNRMTKEQVKNAFSLPTIDSLLIPADSVGHIFIASSDPAISTEAMSAIISRGDSIKIVGVGNWFESSNAGLAIMEGLGIVLAISAVDDVSTLEYRNIVKKYIQKYKSQPSKYFFRGYFGMKVIAESLKTYGTYFQNGYRQQGNFNIMYDYQHTNSNASIKIIKLEDNSIVTLYIN